jgi:hypothetical protein
LRQSHFGEVSPEITKGVYYIYLFQHLGLSCLDAIYDFIHVVADSFFTVALAPKGAGISTVMWIMFRDLLGILGKIEAVKDML